MSAITNDWAITDHPGAQAPFHAVTRPATAIFRTVFDFVRRQIAIHRSRYILHSMPDFILEDIGISRSQIDWVVPERLDRTGRPQGPYPF